LPQARKYDIMLAFGEEIIPGIFLIVAAYLMGSLPFSVWLGQIFFDTDVRNQGSGNAGATNTWRVLGWKAGLPVLALDIGKGLASTYLPFLFSSIASDPDLLLWGRVICGTAAAAGHIFPVFAGFRGGKAVATLLGVMIGLLPLPTIFSLGVFLILFISFRYVSLGSILAGISLPILVYLITDHPIQVLIFSGMITVLVLITHQKNIIRLIRGEESRIVFKKKN